MAVTVGSEALGDEVAAIFAGQWLADPYPIWNRLREEAPVLERGPMFVVSRYDDVKELLADRERYSQALWLGGSRAEAIVGSFSDEGARMWRELAAFDSQMMSRRDGEGHDRLRRISHRYFTPRRVRELEGAIQQFVDDLIEEASAREVYDHRLFAQELPLRVMAHMIGSPQVDRQYVLELSNRIGRYLGTDREDIVRDAYAARQAFTAYVEDVILAEHRRNPGRNEFVSSLMDAESEDNLTSVELVAMVSLVVLAGIETTGVLLSTGMLELLRDREQWELLCREPARAGDAVEELLRYVTPAQWVPRVTFVDVELHGVRIPAGETVMGAVAAAHRDPRAYERPDTLDVSSGARPHLGLGFGAKFCLGASVLRAEARLAFETLARRHPDLDLAVDPSELDWSGSNPLIRGVKELPIRLGPPRG